jgi:hypothetical protein
MYDRGLDESEDEHSPMLRSTFNSPSSADHDYTRSRYSIACSLWTLSAALSLITTKYILVTRNYHYPLHLLLLQLGVASLGSTCRSMRHKGRLSLAFSAPGWRVVWRSRKLRGPFELLAIACAATSLPLAMQALLHFWNLATLAMITVSLSRRIHALYWMGTALIRGIRRSPFPQRPYFFDCWLGSVSRGSLPSGL